MEEMIRIWFYEWNLIEQGNMLLRLIVACILGYLIGYERKNRDKSAGMRTHAIVCLGAALIMAVSKYGFRDVPDHDASRVAAQIVSGVGFLGAGVIFVKNNMVSGLTTAAGIWTTAGVGMAIGAGEYFLGISASILVVVVQILLHKATFLTAEPVRGYLKITTDNCDEVMRELQMQFQQDKIRQLRMKVAKGKSKGEAKLEFDLMYPCTYDKNQLILSWSQDPRIHGISG